MAVPAAITYDNVFRVIIMKFLDAHDMDIRSLKKSCVHIAHPDGRIIPFDIYNLLYRNETTPPPMGVIPPSALQRRLGDHRHPTPPERAPRGP